MIKWESCLSMVTRRDFLSLAGALGLGAVIASSVMPSGPAQAAPKSFPTKTYDRSRLSYSSDNNSGYKDLMADMLKRAEGGGMTILNFQTHDCAGCNVQTDFLERLVGIIAATGRNISMINVVAYDAQGPVYPNIIGHLYREVTGERQLSLPHGQIWRDARYTGRYFSITDGDDLQENANRIGRSIAGEAAKLPIIPD